MALQGTLDTFELPDVLRLLASTRKTGRLHLLGDRGEGDVWLVDGAVVAVEAGAQPGAPAGDCLFELLRAHEGSFAFDPGAEAAEPGEPTDVEPMLAAAEDLLVEWRDIEAVVPSLDAWVRLAEELDGPEVTVDAGTWRLVAAIGSGLPVRELGRSLELGEVAVSRVVRDLVALGLAAVTADGPEPRWAPPTLADVAAGPAPDARPTFEPVLGPAAAAAPVAGFDAAFDAAGSGGNDLDLVGHDGPATVWEHAPAEPVFTVPSFGDADAGLDDADADPDDDGADGGVWTAPAADGGGVWTAPAADDDVARQVALLSPRAAQAVAAVAATAPADESVAPLATADDEDEDRGADRGLLLKFLSSVKP